MKPARHELRQLSHILEAEAEGRPFDRDHARDLAARIANVHPEIRQSMRMICERLDPRA
ncbi:MAG: hypothetical protein M0006_13125 [Magnetospirillum sp.]|nr:hypothetical protein [Magnetospirillum sp.]